MLALLQEVAGDPFWRCALDSALAIGFMTLPIKVSRRPFEIAAEWLVRQGLPTTDRLPHPWKPMPARPGAMGRGHSGSMSMAIGRARVKRVAVTGTRVVGIAQKGLRAPLALYQGRDRIGLRLGAAPVRAREEGEAHMIRRRYGLTGYIALPIILTLAFCGLVIGWAAKAQPIWPVDRMGMLWAELAPEAWVEEAHFIDRRLAWLEQEKNPATNEACCGPTDCHVVNKVERRGGFYFFPELDLSFPVEQTLPSKDGQAWLCVVGGFGGMRRARCAFLPGAGS